MLAIRFLAVGLLVLLVYLVSCAKCHGEAGDRRTLLTSTAVNVKAVIIISSYTATNQGFATYTTRMWYGGASFSPKSGICRAP